MSSPGVLSGRAALTSEMFSPPAPRRSRKLLTKLVVQQLAWGELMGSFVRNTAC